MSLVFVGLHKVIVTKTSDIKYYMDDPTEGELADTDDPDVGKYFLR